MRVLSFTTLFPNREQPSHGVFVENRLAHLVANSNVEITVVAPVPYFPIGHRMFGRYGAFARVPAAEERRGLRVYHPRFLSLPGIGSNVSPFLISRSVRRAVRRIVKEDGPFDLIDAHYFYPDGVAAAELARDLRLPLTITARGSDLNLFCQQPGPRQQILKAAQEADSLITVSASLATLLADMGVPEDKIRVLRNGVDLQLFSPENRDAARRSMPCLPALKNDTSAVRLASVGNLVPLKGHDLVVKALALLPDALLWIVGSGPEEKGLRALAEEIGVAERVSFIGRVPQGELPDIYRGVDILVLASSREGWANVLLESMACGTPVAGSAVGGTPEVIKAPEAGQLIRERSADGIAAAIETILANRPPPEKTRAYAESFSWDDTTRGQVEIFGKVLRRNDASSSRS